MTTLAEAKRNFYESLVVNAATGRPRAELIQAARVYRGEPAPGQMVGPIAVTITTSGMTPTECEFTLRCYAQLAPGALEAQDRLDQLVYALEMFLADTYPRGQWSYTYDPNLDALIAESSIEYPRDDF
jgi:hypothetical protein